MQEIERIDFRDAAKELAKQANIDLAKYQIDPKKHDDWNDDKEKIKRIHKIAQKVFVEQLAKHPEAMKYLKDAKISKNDFLLGEKAIGPDGTIIEKSVLVIKEIKIGNKIVNDIQFTIVKGLKTPMIVGEKPFEEKFGKFSINKEKKQLIFN